MTENYANFANSTVAGGTAGLGFPLQATDTVLILAPGDGTKFPNAPFRLVLGADTETPEVVLVTAIAGDNLTLQRGQESTIAHTWELGTLVQNTITAETMTSIWNLVTGGAFFPLNSQSTASITLTSEAASTEGIEILETAATGHITLRAYDSIFITDPGDGTVRHQFANTGNATHSGSLTVGNGAVISAGGLSVTGASSFNSGITVSGGGLSVTGATTIVSGGLTVSAGGLTVSAGSLSLDGGKITSDGAGLLTINLAASNKYALLTYFNAVPTVTASIIGARVVGDSISRITFQIRSDGYGALTLGPGGNAAPTASLFGKSDGVGISATNVWTSGSFSVTGNIVVNGSLWMDNGAIQSNGVGALSLLNNNSTLEIGSYSVSGTPVIDFHSSGTSHDYDSRITAWGGNSSDGQGALDIWATQINGKNGWFSAAGGFKLASGTQRAGFAGGTINATGSGQGAVFTAMYGYDLANTPTSITFSAVNTGNATSVSATHITVTGFFLNYVSSAAGLSWWAGTFTTVGNCLIAVDTTNQTVDWHCDQCNTTYNALPFSQVQQIPDAMSGQIDTPGHFSIAIICAGCGAIESFSTDLTSADEEVLDPNDTSYTARWNQARMIRQLQQALGLPVLA